MTDGRKDVNQRLYIHPVKKRKKNSASIRDKSDQYYYTINGRCQVADAEEGEYPTFLAIQTNYIR